VEATLTTAAPITVPATPNSEAITAADTAARAPAITCTGLSRLSSLPVESVPRAEEAGGPTL
jgi:hypothetical protein